MIEEQQNRLNNIEAEYEKIKEDSNSKTKAKIEHYLDQRTAETAKLNVEIQEIISKEMKRTMSTEKINETRTAIRRVWEKEIAKISEKEQCIHSLQNQYHESVDQFESQESVSDEDKIQFEQDKTELFDKLSREKASLEELYREKESSLKAYKQNYQNRLDILGWERREAEEKLKNRKEILRQQVTTQVEKLEETYTVLSNEREKYKMSAKVEEDSLKREKDLLEEIKRNAWEESGRKQDEFNSEICNCQELIRNAKTEVEFERTKLDTLLLELGRLTSEYNRSDNGTKERLRDIIETKNLEVQEQQAKVTGLQEQYTFEKIENEEKIQESLHSLNLLKVEMAERVKSQTSKYNDLEQKSRQNLLILRENVDEIEKQLLQYRNNLERDEERLEELRKVEEGMNARADTELLYIAFLLEKDLKEQGKEDQLLTARTLKSNLEEMGNVYRVELSKMQRETEEGLKPLVKNREQAQIVLGDLIRSRGISEVALNELREQFDRERTAESANIESLREKLVDIAEENNLSSSTSKEEITHVRSSDVLNMDRILEKERSR